MSRFVVPDEPGPLSTVRRYRPASEAKSLAASMDAFDQSQHAALEQDREARRAAWRLEAMGQATTAEGRRLMASVVAALQRVHREGFYRVTLLDEERVVRCGYSRNAKLHVNASSARSETEEALRGAGLEVIRSPGSSWDLDVCRPRAERESAPPSTPRRLLAGDKDYQRLRREALDAFGELAGMVGAGVVRVGGPALSDETRRRLTDLAKDLSWSAHWPSQGQLPRVAAACAQKARDVAVEQPALAAAGWRAAQSCLELARFADEWPATRNGGSP